MSQKHPDGIHIATVDGTHYLRVEWIMRQEGSGTRPEYYCRAADWPTTLAGQLHTRDTEIASLQARIAALEQQLATHVVPPAVAAAATGIDEPASEPEAARPGAFNNAGHRARCPICEKRIWPSLLDRHIAEQHPATPAAVVEALKLPAPDATTEELPRPLPPDPHIRIQHPPITPPPLVHGSWRCRVCESDVFAPTKDDPSVCLRCAKARQNGHALAAV